MVSSGWGERASSGKINLRLRRKEVIVVSGVEILQMERGEIPQVVDLWNEAVRTQGEGYERHLQSEGRLETIVDDPNFLPAATLTARQDGELVGFAMGYIQTVDFLGTGDLNRIAGRLAGIAVRPDKWHRGIGRRLLRTIENTLAKNGKSVVSCPVYHKMPLALIRSLHLDSGPFYFLKACRYEDAGHELVFHNDISKYRLEEWVMERKERLRREGISFRQYRSSDRSELLEFVEHYFAGAWHAIIESAVSSRRLPKILLAMAKEQASNRIVGFIGPFDVGEQGRFYFSTDARAGWGSFGSPGVAPSFRRRGIGTVLWHLGFDYLRRSGSEFTEYGTGLDNPAQHMYFRSGAKLIEISCNDMRKNLRIGFQPLTEEPNPS